LKRLDTSLKRVNSALSRKRLRERVAKLANINNIFLDVIF
jgi:hypothetical protein